MRELHESRPQPTKQDVYSGDGFRWVHTGVGEYTRVGEYTGKYTNELPEYRVGTPPTSPPVTIPSTSKNRMQYRSDMDVKIVDRMGDDSSVINAARVSTAGKQYDGGTSLGLINYLMRNRHGSPFEHATITFFVSAPIFVFREFMRHRIASYNEESGRYKELDPVFYLPGPDRKLQQTGKPGHYRFEDGTEEQSKIVRSAVVHVASTGYSAYRRMLDKGVAREVARMVLPLNIYSSMFVTMNARALMNFLSLRVGSDAATYASHPQREIEMVAEQMEEIWAGLMPATYAAFIQNGRVAP